MRKNIWTGLAGGLQHIAGNVHQHAGGDQHLVGHADPDIDQDDHHLCPAVTGQEGDVIHVGAEQADGVQKIGDAQVGHHGVEDAVVAKEVAHQKQGDELGHRDGDDEQRPPEPGQLGLFVIDEHGKKDAAEKAGEGGKERPDQCPDQNLAEGVAEGQRQRLSAAEQGEEV